MHCNLSLVSVEVNISIYWLKDSYLSNLIELDRKIYVTAILFLLVQNRHQTHYWTLIGSVANGLGISEEEGKIYASATLVANATS